MIVAIDGHAGSGKSSLGKRLARDLGMLFIDTGAMYRAVALHFLQQSSLSSPDPEVLLGSLRLGFDPRGEDFRVLLDGQDVTERLRERAVGEMASQVVARLAPVRLLVTRQTRAFAALGDLVVDGRDIGTVVFPDADLKVFLTASPEERARRRQLDSAGGQASTIEQTLVEIERRDHRDSSRELAPLAQAPDAVALDTTGLSLDSAYQRLLGLVLERRHA